MIANSLIDRLQLKVFSVGKKYFDKTGEFSELLEK